MERAGHFREMLGKWPVNYTYIQNLMTKSRHHDIMPTNSEIISMCMIVGMGVVKIQKGFTCTLILYKICRDE